MKLLISAIAILISVNSFCQPESDSIVKYVLNKNIADSAFVLDTHSKNGTKSTVTYLGDIKTAGDRSYKLLNVSSFELKNNNPTYAIFVYSGENRYIGKYPVNKPCEFPDKLTNNNLYFTNSSCENCDRTSITILDFSTGIQGQFFVECKGGEGNTYSFTQ